MLEAVNQFSSAQFSLILLNHATPGALSLLLTRTYLPIRSWMRSWISSPMHRLYTCSLAAAELLLLLLLLLLEEQAQPL